MRTKTLASSEKFRTFALVFSLTAVVVYVLCDLLKLPLFTYHPARMTRRVPLFALWLLPILAVPIMAYTLMSFWIR